MEWKQDDIQKLIEFSDFSAETNLKQKLLSKIISAKKISFNELGEKYGKERKELNGRSEKKEVSRTRQKDISEDRAMNNDEPLLPF